MNEKMCHNPIFCGECPDFLYEDCSGYGICSQDNEHHSCGEKCMYVNLKE